MKLWVAINNVSSDCVVLKVSWSGVGWELKMFALALCLFLIVGKVPGRGCLQQG